MQTTETGRPTDSTHKRPLAVSVVAIVLTLLGALLAGTAIPVLLLVGSTQFNGQFLEHPISVTLVKWQLVSVLLLLGAYVLSIARLLWKMRRAGLLGAYGFAALFLIRGLLSLAPPVRKDDVSNALSLILPAILVIALLWSSSSAFRTGASGHS